MKSISAFLSGCILLSAVFNANAQAIDDPKDFPSSDFVDDDTKTVKTCYDSDSDCTLRVAMSCTYEEKGITKNCMDTSSVKGNRPFLTLSKDECKARESILATIKYTTCNENNVEFKPITRKNDIRFRKDTSVKPVRGWDDAVAPKTCRQYVIEENFDLCKRRRVMENQFDGNLDQDFPKYCRCFLYKQSFILLTTPPPIGKGPPALQEPSSPPSMRPSSGPTASPTTSPSSPPSFYPTVSPTTSPSSHPSFYPTTSPTTSPVVPQCNELGVIITEIVSPFGSVHGKYIELYFGDKCGNHVIQRDIFVRRYIKGLHLPLQKIHLKNKLIPIDGFFVICMDIGTNIVYGVGTCDYVNDPSNNPFDIDGTDTFEIIEYDSPDYKIIDIYGRKVPHVQDDQDFTGGRCVRKLPFKTPRLVWNPQQWHVIPGKLSPVVPDPREWKDVIIVVACKYFLTELADPVDVPLAAFIEIKTTCPGAPIPDNLYVKTWKFSHVIQYLNPPLANVPADSFIIICENKTVFEATFPGKACDIENVPLQPGGVHPIGLYMDYIHTPIDIYGSTQVLPRELIFVEGRAYRKLSAPKGSEVCAPRDWVVIPGSIIGGTVTAVECDPRDWKADEMKLYFTELADPSDAPDKRFIELYSPNRRNYAIEAPLFIMKHDPFSEKVVGTYSLTSVLVNGEGFIVVCATYFHRCTSIAGFTSIINSAGTYAWTLQACPNGVCEVIDSYGFGCFGGDHSYEDGRAVRKKDAQPKPSATFFLSHWDIYRDIPFSETTPGEWENEDEKTQPPAPPSPPASAPSKGKGKSKSKRKMRKERRM